MIQQVSTYTYTCIRERYLLYVHVHVHVIYYLFIGIPGIGSYVACSVSTCDIISRTYVFSLSIPFWLVNFYEWEKRFSSCFPKKFLRGVFANCCLCFLLVCVLIFFLEGKRVWLSCNVFILICWGRGRGLVLKQREMTFVCYMFFFLFFSITTAVSYQTTVSFCYW